MLALLRITVPCGRSSRSAASLVFDVTVRSFATAGGPGKTVSARVGRLVAGPPVSGIVAVASWGHHSSRGSPCHVLWFAMLPDGAAVLLSETKPP
jgi:hypothetical protein